MKSAQVKVIRWTDKSSVEVGMMDGVDIVSVGKVTVHAKYVKQIKEGDLIRVRYLYATDAKQLYQANLDPMDDQSIMADVVDQITTLKFEGKDE
jgi:hypothetical protein